MPAVAFKIYKSCYGTGSFCFCYVDNILVFTKNEEPHKIHLHKIANRLNAYSLKLNLKKCLIGLTKITALRYTLSAKGITASQEKVKAIQQLPEPTTIKELRQALGLINYQRKFIPNAAGILAPLTAYFIFIYLFNSDSRSITEKKTQQQKNKTK